MIEEVILVDENDRELGTMEKLAAHQRGVLHRAISVFIFNANGDFLLQKRAAAKYHSAGLWTNTCCSHPRPGETSALAASRRLQEEMGLNVPLQFKTAFVYRSEFENGLTEHEYDHVYTGMSLNEPVINPDEAAAYKWMARNEILEDIKARPDAYTSWFRIAMREIF